MCKRCPIVARGCHYKHVVLETSSYRLHEESICGFWRAGFATRDGNDMGTLVDCSEYRARKIALGAGNVHFAGVSEDWQNQTAAAWDQSVDRASRLPEQDAGDMRAVAAGR